MFLGINSIYTPVYLPLCEYGQNQPPCADVGLLLNMARTCSFHSLVWAILRSNPPSLHVGWFFKIYPSAALGVYFPIYTPRSIYRSVYLIKEQDTFICLQNVSNKTDQLTIICEIPVFPIRVLLQKHAWVWPAHNRLPGEVFDESLTRSQGRLAP